MRIAAGSDHLRSELKDTLVNYLNDSGYEIVDYGPNSKERTDDPIFRQRVSKGIIKKKVDVGMSLAGNKSFGIAQSFAENLIR